MFEGLAFQDFDDAVGVDGAIGVDRECFAGELVDHIQDLRMGLLLTGQPARRAMVAARRPRRGRSVENRRNQPRSRLQ